MLAEPNLNSPPTRADLPMRLILIRHAESVANAQQQAAVLRTLGVIASAPALHHCDEVEPVRTTFLEPDTQFRTNVATLHVAACDVGTIHLKINGVVITA